VPPDPLVAQLAAIVGPEHVVTGHDATRPYCVDWSGRFRGTTPAVVRPRSTEEVAALVALCRERAVAIVPQGGNTGLVGGGVPLAGEVVLSVRRLDGVGDVDPEAGQLTVGAGATLAAAQRAAASAGWAYGVDIASRETATIGGNVAANAGGLRVLRYGDTRAQVVGIEAVLGDGSIVSHLRGLVKDNTGYHLESLLCGSEGTLGVVTRVRLRLVPRADERVAVLLAFDSVGTAVAAAAALRRHVRTLEAVELFLGDGLDLVGRALALPPPSTSRHPAYLLVEAADTTSPAAELAAAVAALPSLAAPPVVASEPADRARLWRYREGHAEAVSALGPPHKFDVALPTGVLADFLAAVPSAVGVVVPHARTWIWGHVAEGNVHVNVTGVAPEDERVDDAVLGLVVRLGGSVSGEHGIGTARRAWLARSRTAAEVDAFRAVKRALDPDGILNPNVLLPPG
jgi:FAD/FMN-containing dehydrogenase